MMTAEQLKKSILNMALQGKLVEQRPEEGTGKDLYERIRHDKKTLINNKILKKEKPLPFIMEEEIPFDIPKSWIWVRLGKITNSLFAGGDKPRDFTEKPDENRKVPVIANGITNDGILGYTATSTAKANTITVAGRGTIGFSVFRNYDYCPVVRLIVIEQNKYVYPQYLQYTLQALPEKSLGTSIPQLTVPMLYPKLIPLPPLAEQKRIVAKIEELMPFVEQYAAASTKLNTLNATFPEMMKKSILQEAVQGKLVPQDPNDEPASVLLEKIAKEKKRLIKEGKIKKQKPLPEITEDEIPFDIPESWEWVRFSEIMNSISTGPFGSMLHKTDYENEGIPIVNPIHMQGRRIIPSSNSLISNKTAERLSAYKLQAGDIVLARRGDIGRSVVVHEAESGWICGTGSFFATPSKGINPDFISLMFTTPYVRQALLGESVGTTMNNLNQKILLSFLFPLPPEKEQERILGAFDNLNRVLTGLATIS